MRPVLAILAALLTACAEPHSKAPTAPSSPATVASEGVTYLNVMMDVMQANSIKRKTIDWPGFRGQVLAATPAAARIPDTYPAIRVALGLLGDNHSSYTSASGTFINNSSLSCTATTVSGTPALGSDLGYVRVTSFSGGGAPALAFADAIQRAIRTADGPMIRGWIVDLRGNGGGNMWPMIAGIGPILGTGTSGFFITPDGATTSWGYSGTGSQSGGSVAQATTAPYTLMSAAPKVAVLIDQRVASSGEAVAVAFEKRPNTRFFGAATCGLSTANSGFTLYDGALLNLTVAVMADRAGTIYGGPLQPEEPIADVAQVLTRATAWLRTP